MISFAGRCERIMAKMIRERASRGDSWDGVSLKSGLDMETVNEAMKWAVELIVCELGYELLSVGSSYTTLLSVVSLVTSCSCLILVYRATTRSALIDIRA